MFTTKVEAIIKAPIEKVFNYVRNLETMPEYNDFLKSSKWKDENEIECVIRLNISVINIQSEYKITELIDCKKIIARCESSGLVFEDIYEFEKREDFTFLRITDVIELKGLLRLSEGFLSGIFGKEMQGNMDRLVQILEKKK